MGDHKVYLSNELDAACPVSQALARVNEQFVCVAVCDTAWCVCACYDEKLDVSFSFFNGKELLRSNCPA